MIARQRGILCLAAQTTDSENSSIIGGYLANDSMSSSPKSNNQSRPALFLIALMITSIASFGVQSIDGDPWVSVDSPLGGEEYTVGDEVTIQWSTSGTANEVDIYYAVGRGEWHAISTGAGNGADGSGSYLWTVPDNPNQEVQVKVSAVTESGEVFDTSGFFSIVSSAGEAMRIISPNGGEAFSAGDEVTIRWSAPGNERVNLYYQLNPEEELVSIIEGLPNDEDNDGEDSYVWTAPDVNSDTVRVIITGMVQEGNDDQQDISDDVFSIGGGCYCGDGICNTEVAGSGCPAETCESCEVDCCAGEDDGYALTNGACLQRRISGGSTTEGIYVCDEETGEWVTIAAEAPPSLEIGCAAPTEDEFSASNFAESLGEDGERVLMSDEEGNSYSIVHHGDNPEALEGISNQMALMQSFNIKSDDWNNVEVIESWEMSVQASDISLSQIAEAGFDKSAPGGDGDTQSAAHEAAHTMQQRTGVAFSAQLGDSTPFGPFEFTAGIYSTTDLDSMSGEEVSDDGGGPEPERKAFLLVAVVLLIAFVPDDVSDDGGLQQHATAIEYGLIVALIATISVEDGDGGWGEPVNEEEGDFKGGASTADATVCEHTSICDSSENTVTLEISIQPTTVTMTAEDGDTTDGLSEAVGQVLPMIIMQPAKYGNEVDFVESFEIKKSHDFEYLHSTRNSLTAYENEEGEVDWMFSRLASSSLAQEQERIAGGVVGSVLAPAAAGISVEDILMGAPLERLLWTDLGASQVATSSADTDSYGDLYQWGRTTSVGGDGCWQVGFCKANVAVFNADGSGDLIGARILDYDQQRIAGEVEESIEFAFSEDGLECMTLDPLANLEGGGLLSNFDNQETLVALGDLKVTERDAVVAGAVGGTTFTLSAVYAHLRHARAAATRAAAHTGLVLKDAKGK